MNQEDKIQTEYEEINLADYIKVLLKKKRIIFTTALIVIIATTVYSFFISPKVYKVDTLIEIGKISGSFIEEPTQLVEKIDNDIYGISIRKKLELSEAVFPEMKTKIPEKTGLVLLRIESEKPKLAKAILEETNNLIIAEHFNRIKNKKELIEKDVERLKTKLAFLEEEKNNLEKKEKSLEWLSPYGRVSEQLTGSLFALLDIREKLSSKKQEIENLYLQINFLQNSLEDIQPTKIIKTPTILENPIKPRPVLNIVIAIVLGIFLGVFFAFGKEWWEKNRS